MASACRCASVCSRAAMGVSDTRARIRASSAASASTASCSSATRSSSRSARRRSATSKSLRSMSDRDIGPGVYRGPLLGHLVTVDGVNLAAWGVDDGYWDASGRWQDVPPESLEAITGAIGVDGEAPPPGPPLWFVRAGHVEFLLGPADLVLEDGATIRGVEALPRDLPPGY